MFKNRLHIMISIDKCGRSLQGNIKTHTLYMVMLVAGVIITSISVGVKGELENVYVTLRQAEEQIKEYEQVMEQHQSQLVQYNQTIEALEITIADLNHTIKMQETNMSTIEQAYDTLQRNYESLTFFEEKMSYVPTYMPTNGIITSSFGSRSDPFGGGWEIHKGIDIGANHGDPIWAAAKGVIEEAGVVNGYGKMILIDHGDGTKTRYAHASKLLVEVGETVEKGQKIAEIGSTGNSTGPHLHFEWIEGTNQINPTQLFIESGNRELWQTR